LRPRRPPAPASEVALSPARPRVTWLALAAAALLALAGLWRGAPPASPPATPAGPELDQGADRLRAAARDRREGVPVTVRATVTRLLADDREGSPHQRFLVRAAGLTILVAHNLALAPRVPVSPGDTVEIRGEYVWNPKGGVLHWTHRDPDGRHPAGYISAHGHRYQ
jgi:hypothetical protein